MRVIAVSNLSDFWEQHPGAKGSLEAWIDEVKHAQWESAHDIKARYPRARILENKRIIFDLKGNDYRLIIGRSNRVYEILNGKRNLTLAMVWKRHKMFGTSAESLIKPPRR